MLAYAMFRVLKRSDHSSLIVDWISTLISFLMLSFYLLSPLSCAYLGTHVLIYNKRVLKSFHAISELLLPSLD